MRAAHIITAIRRQLAEWLYEPFHTTQWQPSSQPLALPAPAADPQHTGPLQVDVIGGFAGGPQWHGPVGTWRDVYRKTSPHRRRDTGILVPSQTTGAMGRIRPAHLTPIPATNAPERHELPSWLTIVGDDAPPIQRQHGANSAPVRDEFGFADLTTWKTRETMDRQISDAIARIDSARLPMIDPPVLVPLPEQSLSVTDRTAISNLFAVTEEDCAPNLEEDPDETKASALLKLRFCEHKKGE